MRGQFIYLESGSHFYYKGSHKRNWNTVPESPTQLGQIPMRIFSWHMDECVPHTTVTNYEIFMEIGFIYYREHVTLVLVGLCYLIFSNSIYLQMSYW